MIQQRQIRQAAMLLAVAAFGTFGAGARPARAIELCRYTDMIGEKFSCTQVTEKELGLPPLASITLRRPGDILFDRAARERALHALPASRREALCGSAPDLAPVAPPALGEDDAQPVQRSLERVPFAASRWFGLGDAKSADYVVQSLASWAKADAMTGIDWHDLNPIYFAKLWLYPTIVSRWLVSDSPALDPARKAEIDAYLARLRAHVDFNFGRRQGLGQPLPSDLANHRWTLDASNMAWGALTGDTALFAKGMERYAVILAGLVRPDGSPFFESQRGGRALFYTGHNIGTLVTYAEMAAVQGYDLYGIAEHGIDIHKLVAFYLDALDRPELIHPYAKSQLYCPEELCGRWDHQQMDWVTVDGWEYAYAKRFPDHPNTKRLVARFPELASAGRHPPGQRYGGDALCLVGPLRD